MEFGKVYVVGFDKKEETDWRTGGTTLQMTAHFKEYGEQEDSRNNPEFEDVVSLEGVAPTKNKSVPIFAVPTTAGTAAEVTINYVITDVSKNRKMVCVDPKDIPVVAFVDPEMMATMPKGLTAATGMDALTHAIEGYITAGAWELSDMFHLKAIEIISRSLRGAVDNTPEGLEDWFEISIISGAFFCSYREATSCKNFPIFAPIIV